MSILSIAYSGLNAFQLALDVAGNNITNSTTKGYSRQSILLSPTLSQRQGGAFIGTGVAVNSIYRNTDQFATMQVRNTLSIKNQYDTFYQEAIQVDKLISQEESSISKALQNFFDAFNQLNNSPDNAASRGVALSQTQVLAQQFQFIQSNLDQFQENATKKMSVVTTKINELSAELVSLNKEIMGTPNAPELLDRRDQLLTELAGYSELTIMEQDNGTVNVGIGTGEMLVIGTNMRSLSVFSDPQSTLGSRVVLGSPTGQLDVTTELTTGMLGGLLSYEKDVIAKASQTIGMVAIGLSERFNAQNQLGIDLYNQQGQNVFTDYNASSQQLKRAIASANNTGTATLSVEISDLSNLQLSDYQLVVSDVGTNELRVIRESDGQSFSLNWSNNPPGGEVVIDGLTIRVDNLSQLANQDSFKLIPTRGAARNFSLTIQDPNLLALASPVKTSAAMKNTGTGQIAINAVFHQGSTAGHYLVDFTSTTEFNLVDADTNAVLSGPIPFTPNVNNVVNIPDASNPSYAITLSGMPQAGDQFHAQFNQGGAGDNRNGLLLAGLQRAQIFENGNETFFDVYSHMLSEVGSQTSQAKNRAAAFDILNKQAVNLQESKSGVNLEEEGANLLRFQQAYAAAGKLMEISNQMMQVLFQMMR